MNPQNKSVLVFGTFDKLHEGHRSFLSQAKNLGSHLTVCLAQDSIVEALKQKKPSESLLERQTALESVDHVDQIIAGDTELGTYRCITKSAPDIIALGYDQEALKQDLQKWLKTQNLEIELVSLNSFKPETYKTSLLH